MLKWAETDAKYFPNARGMMYQRKYLVGSSVLGTPHARNSGGRKTTMDIMWKSDTVTGYGKPFRMILFTTFPPELTVYQHTHRNTMRTPSLVGGRSAAAAAATAIFHFFGFSVNRNAKVRRGAPNASLPLVGYTATANRN